MSFGLNFVWTSCLTTVKILLDMAQFYSDIADDQLLSAALYKGYLIDCKTVGFFFKISKEIGKAWRKSLKRARASHARKALSLFSASFQTFFLTARAYLNTQILNTDCFAV